MRTVSFIGGSVARFPMPSQFKEQARLKLFERLQAVAPDSQHGGREAGNWAAVWEAMESYGGFYYAYGVLSYVLRSR